MEIANCSTKCKILRLENKDIPNLIKAFHLWVNLSTISKYLKGRFINLPEVITEWLYCLTNNSVRVVKLINSKISSSFDCYNFSNKHRIQIKGSCSKEDLTSFSPNSFNSFDLCIFIQLQEPWGKGIFKIYELSKEDIENVKVNKKQRLLDLQIEGKRPRFSIVKEFILKKNLQSIKKICIFDI